MNSVICSKMNTSDEQAIQLYWFTHLAVTTELNPWDAFSPGRLDQHLIKYYEAAAWQLFYEKGYNGTTAQSLH